MDGGLEIQLKRAPESALLIQTGRNNHPIDLELNWFVRGSEMKQRWKIKLVVCLFLLQTALVSSAPAVEVNREEQAEAKRWVAAKFTGKIEPVPAQNYLTLVGDRGTIERNARADHEIGEGFYTVGEGRPLRIFNTLYERGLYLHDAQGVVVHLTSPKTLEAVIGLD